MSKWFMLNVTILLVITLQLVHAASHLRSYENQREKRDLYEELEKLLNRHKNRSETDGPSVNLKKLQLLKEKMKDVSALLDEIYNEADGKQGSEDSAQTKIYADCAEVYRSGNKASGVYRILNNVTQAYCNMEIDKGGWTVFQRRFNGSVDFYRSWDEYRDGFGDVNGEYWLGLERLHQLLQGQNKELYIILEEFDGNGTMMYAKYSTFRLKSEAGKYAITTSGFSGNAGDGLHYHNNMPFSTKDRDNDNKSGRTSCSMERTGAWWYNNCMMSNLNGKYRPSARYTASYGFSWHPLKKTYQYFLKGSTMMIRPASFKTQG